MIDFNKGEKPKQDPELKTDSEKFVKSEEDDLIQVLRERLDRQRRTREARDLENPDAPSKFYVGEKEVTNLVLSPDGRFVTFRLVDQARNSKRTIVPNYITETGFTTDLNARPKVGAPQRPSDFAFVDLERDTLRYIRPDTLPRL